MKKGQLRSGKGRFGYVRIVGEKSFDTSDFTSKNSDAAHKFAKRRKRNPTNAERKFEQILTNAGDNSYVGEFEREWAICGKWILDFYFPKYRLAIEVDGNYHNSAEQTKKDIEKAADCEKLEISLLRFTNQEIFGDRTKLLEKLKHGLEIAALKAENCTKKPIVSATQKSNKPEKRLVQLTKREQNLIREHFEFYKSLAVGKRQPTTAEQKHFVAVCQGQLKPETEHEIAFAKFIRIQSAQLKKKI